jgi:hypothetical protein
MDNVRLIVKTVKNRRIREVVVMVTESAEEEEKEKEASE